jgi:pimeloyl-ACP methyl ester carboxylesterase
VTRPIRERALRFGPADRLAGILTMIPESASARPPAVFVNAGVIHRVGPDRLYVEVARTIAAQGVASLRFDLSGLGDSQSADTTLSLEASVMEDIGIAIDTLLRATRSSSCILIGLCSGANHALLAAANDPRVVGVLLIDPTVERTVRGSCIHLMQRLTHPATLMDLLLFRHPVYYRDISMRSAGMSRDARRIAVGRGGERAEEFASDDARPGFRTTIETLVQRGVHMMIVFTGGVNHVYNYRNQLFDLLPGLDFGNLLSLEFMPGSDHTVSDRASREQFLGNVTLWLATAFASPDQARSTMRESDNINSGDRTDLLL